MFQLKPMQEQEQSLALHVRECSSLQPSTSRGKGKGKASDSDPEWDSAAGDKDRDQDHDEAEVEARTEDDALKLWYVSDPFEVYFDQEQDMLEEEMANRTQAPSDMNDKDNIRDTHKNKVASKRAHKPESPWDDDEAEDTNMETEDVKVEAETADADSMGHAGVQVLHKQHHLLTSTSDTFGGDYHDDEEPYGAVDSKEEQRALSPMDQIYSKGAKNELRTLIIAVKKQELELERFMDDGSQEYQRKVSTLNTLKLQLLATHPSLKTTREWFIIWLSLDRVLYPYLAIR
ncbi:hypothetical protein BT96DRAFT_948522 [Gymnopus androsaceus JB14]|uniref:Uncharacterized protein n=1 Tax=Gymnopus androsaceus JB14 TaxID=1447944 RepID=A0A6A4GPT1_9AGAR|nr:hypothetical protein BT96DRAFT_948522 [Gymnopus androsaceus JB14]